MGSKLEGRITRFDRLSSRIATWRLLLFFGAIGAALFGAFGRLPWLSYGVAALCVLGFIGLIWVHESVERFVASLRARSLLASRIDAARELRWDELPYLPESHGTQPQHFSDLDIDGERSLLRLMNFTISMTGYLRLRTLLSSTEVEATEVERRVRLVGELRRMRGLRMRFLVEVLRDPRQIDTGTLQALLAQPLADQWASRMLGALVAIQAATLAAFGIYSAQEGRTAPWFLAGIALLFLAHQLAKRWIHAGHAYEHAISMSFSLDRFARAVGVLERYAQARTGELAKTLEPFRDSESAARMIRPMDRIVGALGVKQNFIARGLLHVVFPWDAYWTVRLERMRQRLLARLPLWIEALTEYEAFSSLAMFAAINPEYVPARGSRGEAFLDCEDVKHPLLPRERAVGNDIRLDRSEHCVLLTGSNMSGKSTFLRSLGVNLVLASAGAPVAARRFEFTPALLMTSIRGGDSIQEGLSSFHAEVKRLKQVLDLAERGPILFLIDEIFRGTNNRERLLGSKAYLNKLVQTKACGVVSTHDLELASLEQAHPGIVNYHFKEDFFEGTMRFSYRKARGPSPSTNALEVMKINGLPIA